MGQGGNLKVNAHRTIRTRVVAMGAILAAVGGMAIAVSASPASAAVADTKCRASTLVALGSYGAPANLPLAPCKSQTNVQAPINIPLAPLLSVYEGTGASVTTLGPNGIYASAETGIAITEIKIAGLKILLGPITSVAHAFQGPTCAQNAYAVQSNIAYVRINNLPAGGGKGYLALNLGIGTLYLNQSTKVGGTVTQRAAFLDLPGTGLDIVVGEATAGVKC
jgi:hypothetical protein